MRAFVVSLLLMIGAPALAAEAIDGFWYGEGYQPTVRETMQWLVHRRQNGSFEIEFRRYENCRLVYRQRESGTWTYQKGIETTITDHVNGREVDTNNPFYHDTYRVDLLTDKEMHYVHLNTGQPYQTRRVDAEFIFPDCST